MQSFKQFQHAGQAAEAHISRARETTLFARRDTAPRSERPDRVHHSQVSDAVRNDLEAAPEKHSADLEASRIGGDAGSGVDDSAEVSLARAITGVDVKTRSDGNEDNRQVFLVDWEGPDDPLNPRNWSLVKRLVVMLQISLIGLGVGAKSGIDSTIVPQAANEFGVSQVTESAAVGLYLVGIGLGSLVAGPFSETFGRNAVYTGSMIIFMIWVLGAGLAPNIGAQLAFRLLAGCSSSTPMVCAGGSISDMWNSLEKTWSFPLYTGISFGGPMIGAVMGAYIGPSDIVSWRWVEWVILIMSGLILILVLFLMPETYGPLLLQWRASHYRRITGDDRYRSEHEIADATLLSRLKVSMTRPFLMLTEPIILAMTLYISVLYIVMFTFLVGWPYIFEYPYGIDQGLSHIIFMGMFVGTQCIGIMVPFVYKKTANAIKQAESRGEGDTKHVKFSPEIRLWYGMLGAAVSIPVSLFWMGWTSSPNISIWSPIIASAFFGFGVTGIFVCTYMYIIDSYEGYSASALTFVALTRYVIAGGMTVGGISFYERMGTSYMLTILGSISLALVPIPYLLYFYGHWLRDRSRYAISWNS